MKLARQAQGIWWALMACLVATGVLCWWIPSHLSSATLDEATRQLLTTVLLGVALFEIGIVTWLFLASWQPVAEKSLKKVWAGRLLDPAEGKTIGQTLFSRSLVIMVLCEAPAVYAVLLTICGATQPLVIWGLLGASTGSLLYFRWQGLDPVTDIFRQIDRIAQP